MDRFLAALGVPPAGLAAAGDVRARLSWNGRRIGAGRGRGVARLAAEGHGTPVTGTVLAQLDGDGTLRFSSRELRLGSHRIRWSGPMTLGDWVPSWSVHSSGGRLAELVPVVNAWVGHEVLPAALTGRGDLELAFTGPFSAPRVSLRLGASGFGIGRMVADRAAVQLEIGRGSLRVASAAARLGDGTAHAAGAVHWAEGSVHLDLDLAGRELPVERVTAWAGLPELIHGRIGFSGSLAGTVTSPRGTFAVGVSDLRVAGVPLGPGNATVELDRGTFRLRSCQLDSGVAFAGRWRVATGELGLKARGEGLDTTQFSPVVASLFGNRSRLEAEAEVAREGLHRATVRLWGPTATAELNLHAARGRFRLKVDGAGSTELDLERHPEGSWSAAGSAEVTSVATLLRRVLGEQAPPMDGALAARVDGSWRPGSVPNVVLRPERAAFTVMGRQVSLAPGAEVTLGAGVSLHGVMLRSPAGIARLNLGVNPKGELNGQFGGTLDGSLLALVAPRWRPAGRLEGTVRFRGTVHRPGLSGKLSLHNGALNVGGGLAVTGMEGTLRAGGRRFTVDLKGAQLLGGKTTLRGSVDAADGRLALRGEAAGIRLEPLPQLLLTLAGSWRLTGPVEHPLLSGELEVERGRLATDEEVDRLLLRWFGPEAVPGPRLPEIPELRLHVVANRSVEARTPFVRATVSADLQVRGSPAEPGLLGTVNLAEEGDLLLRGLRYELERFSLTFTDPERIRPQIEVRARTWVDIYDITVTLVGTPSQIVPTLVSDPPLETADILSLLSLGRREERGGGLGATLASTILTRQINAELERRASSLLALDQIRVDPFAESTTGNPTARLTVVKQLTPSWTVVLGTNLSSNREEVVVSRWYLERGLFLEATRDADGSYSLDLKLRRRY